VTAAVDCDEDPVRLPVRLAVPMLAGALLVAAAAVPAAAAAPAPVPVPAPRTFGSVADNFPQFERENTCSPTEKPGAKKLRKLLKKTYGSSISSNTVRACTSADSGHEEGRAVDWMTNKKVPAQKAMAKAFIAWLEAPDSYGNTYAMARRLGVEYVIWNNRMWRTYDTGRGWTEYDNCLHKQKKGKAAWANACHRTHVHISLSWDGAYKRTSYFSGYVACPAAWTPWTPSAAPVASPTVTPVTLTRILSTQTGLAMTNGPCRARGGSRLDLAVLGQAGVPQSGVASVVLRVALVSPDSATALRVWPAGTTMPTTTVPAPASGAAFTEITVPVSSNGWLSLQHSFGMSQITVDVVGYHATVAP
jgi:hypothetical protein